MNKISRLARNKKIAAEVIDRQKAFDLIEDETVEQLEMKVIATIGRYKDVEYTIVKSPDSGLDYYTDNLTVNDYILDAGISADDIVEKGKSFQLVKLERSSYTEV